MLTLEDEALDAVLETDDTVITRVNNSAKATIINMINKLFKNDSTITKYQALEAFETFKRPSNMSIQAFLNKFEEIIQEKIYFWHLLMNLKNNSLLKKLLKWPNKKQNNFNIYNVAFFF